MAKFNFIRTNKTKNISGHEAFKMNSKDKLLVQVLTSFFNESKYYGDNSNEIVDTIKKVIEEDPEFVSNLAVYARNEMHFRTISHVLIAELAKSNNGKAYVRKTMKNSIQRVDDMTEILSYYINNYGKPIPNSLKKGIADSIVNFDEYQLAKYNRDGAVKLKDLLCLVHPKAKDDQQNHMFSRLLDDKLKTPITWETQLSSRGNKKDVWEELINENKLGYMAMLRNLRNIINNDVSNINKVYDFLANEGRVIKNKQLPFRYYSAYKTLKNEGIGTSKIFDTLETAIKHSTKNINRLAGKSLISADVSGSMNSRISYNSDITCAEIAVVMMSIANYICEETITTTFDTDIYRSNLSTSNGIIANANSIKVNGGGTDVSLPIRYLLTNKIYVDRIIILSDNEINCGYGRVCQKYVEEYKKKINPNVWVHAIDMQGYGTQQFSGERVNIIAGWNDRVLDFIHQAEEGIGSLRDKVEKCNL